MLHERKKNKAAEGFVPLPGLDPIGWDVRMEDHILVTPLSS